MMDGGKNIFSTNTNINNFVINNSNQPISLQFNNANNSPFFNNILFSQNGSDFINYPQISNNQQIFNNQNGFINQNFINNKTKMVSVDEILSSTVKKATTEGEEKKNNNG